VIDGPWDVELEDTRMGAGTSGGVQKGVIKKTGQRVAVKTFKMESKERKEQVLNEVRALVMAEACPNLITWYGSFADRGNVIVVLELADLGCLKNLMKRVGQGRQVAPEHCAYITASTIGGLKFLHDRRIVHRNVKPENILHNSSGEVKLTDFGFSRSLDATVAMAGTQIGTQIYMAPEMCMGQDYSFSIDIWSYGLVLYEVATGTFPFPPLSNFAVLFQSICEDPEPRLSPDYPMPMQEFLALCLTREVRDRGDSDRLAIHSFVFDGPHGTGLETQDEFAAFLS
jgi:serine/threonine protein kinase